MIANLLSCQEDLLKKNDPQIYHAINEELHRQQNQIELIASENIVNPTVLAAQGSVLTNKYAEGYVNRRYYGGCEFVDIAEKLAIDRSCELFECQFANVQPHSGSQANQAVFNALLAPGDTFLGMNLASGGHLTHGAKPNQSGKWFNAIQYGVRKEDCLIDFDEIRTLAHQEKPKLIIAGGSAIPRIIDFRKFRAICDEVGALFMVDMAHFAGLVATKVHPSPFPYADVATTTTHKTLRGPRGGAVFTNNQEIIKKVNSAVFPGIQGGPLMHVIAAKAVAFGEALKPEFVTYSEQVVANAKVLAETLIGGGLDIVTGGTDTHVMLVDLRPMGIRGVEAETSLERANIACNKNGIPFDTEKPTITSGIRLGTPACTSRGFMNDDFELVGKLILKTLAGLAQNGLEGNAIIEDEVRKDVQKLCSKYPIYQT